MAGEGFCSNTGRPGRPVLALPVNRPPLPHIKPPASPAAGAAIHDMTTNAGAGNAQLANLPRKINIGMSTTRDDFAHCHINDVGLKVRPAVPLQACFSVPLQAQLRALVGTPLVLGTACSTRHPHHFQH